MHSDPHRNDTETETEFWAIVDAMGAAQPVEAVQTGSSDVVSHAQAVADAGAHLWTLPFLA